MIGIGNDHAAIELKHAICEHLAERGIKFTDYGIEHGEKIDYPDMAERVCRDVVSGKLEKAILLCGTGVGISISANKIKGIRACCCSDTFSAKYTRLHNDANVICMGGRVVGPGLACEIVDLFLDTGFEGGRHQRRVDKITALEQKG